MKSTTTLARDFRASAHEMELKAARLAREAKALRLAAYQLNPRGRPPGRRTRRKAD